MLELADKHIIMVIITTSRVDKLLDRDENTVYSKNWSRGMEDGNKSQIKLLVMKTIVCLMKTHWIKLKD